VPSITSADSPGAGGARPRRPLENCSVVLSPSTPTRYFAGSVEVFDLVALEGLLPRANPFAMSMTETMLSVFFMASYFRPV